METLPIEIIQEVTNYLCPRDTTAVSETCRYLKEAHRTVTRCLRPLETPDETHQALVAFPNVTNLTLHGPPYLFPDIPLKTLKLVVDGACAIDDLRKYTSLSSLTLTDTVEGYQPLLGMPNLSELELRIDEPYNGRENLDNPSLTRLRIHGRSLIRRGIIARNLRILDAENVILDQTVFLPNLRVLRCMTITANLSLPTLEILGLTLGGQLSTLDAPLVRKLYVNVLPGEESPFGRYPNIQELWLHSSNIPFQILAADLLRMPLRAISIMIPETDEPVPVDVANIIGIPTLESISLFPTNMRHVWSLEFWRPTLFRNVRKLNISNTNIPDSVLVNMDLIQVLIIPGSMNITDYGICTLLQKRQSALYKINVEYCSNLTEDSLRAIQEHCHQYRFSSSCVEIVVLD